MDYSKISIELIERSFNRNLSCYTEKHYIVPRCMGGDDKQRNIAILTPEEHFLAHQLLVKIYPDNRKLVFAVDMMCYGGSEVNRPNNKRFGWIKRRVSDSLSKKQKGKKASQEAKLRMSESHKKPINQYSKEGKLIRRWCSAIEAAKELRVAPTNITAHLRGKRPSYKGFVWKCVEY